MSRGLGVTQRRILELLDLTPDLSTRELGRTIRKEQMGRPVKSWNAQWVDFTTPTVERALRTLMQRRLVERKRSVGGSHPCYLWRRKCSDSLVLHLGSDA